MSWSIGSDGERDIGYGVPAYCDHPGCTEEIDRGLSYRCGDGLYDYKGCGLFFCGKHLVIVSWFRGNQLCSRCYRHKGAFTPKPDHPRWIRHKLKDKSWAAWRKENPSEVRRLRLQIASSSLAARYSHNSLRSTVPLTVHLSEGLAESLDTFCSQVGKSRSEVIREAVTLYLMNQALTECRETKP